MASGAHTRRGRRVATTTLALAVLAAACTGGSDDPVATAPTTTTEPTQPRIDDGVLRIGALIPVNDPAVGADLSAAVERAVEELNDAGGVLGRDVVLIIADEGDTATTAAQAAQQLLAEGVDAIVGPTTSNNAIGALDETTASGIVTCSATATAISLDEFPDRSGLFFRTIATDSLQATAIAGEAQRRGAGRVGIIHVDDAFGRPYAEAVTDALSSQPSILVTSVAVPFNDVDLDDDLDELAEVGADTAIVLGNGDDVARFLEAIDARTDIEFRRVIVNDAARSSTNRPLIASLDPGFRTRIVGIAPQIVLPEADDDDDAPFASQIFDCVNLIALAAAQGESDSPEVIASQMTSVSSGGVACRTFAGCLARLDNDEQIDYDGPTGITELARDGDPSRAFFDRFGFDEDGADVYRDSVAVS